MLILLPPSEGKTPPVRGRSADLDRLAFSELHEPRTRVAEALIRLCTDEPERARAVLGISAAQAHQIHLNAQLREAPAAPAWQIYSGVLYEVLDAGSLQGRGRQRLSSQVVIASALWGLVRAGDRIPAYRLSAGVTLPGLGPLRDVWQGAIGTGLLRTRGLIVDMRSSAYVALGRIPSACVDRTLTVSVYQVRAGRRVTVSHDNKATKGHLARLLLEHGGRPSCPHDVLAVCHDAGLPATLTQTARGSWNLDVSRTS